MHCRFSVDGLPRLGPTQNSLRSSTLQRDDPGFYASTNSNSAYPANAAQPHAAAPYARASGSGSRLYPLDGAQNGGGTGSVPALAPAQALQQYGNVPLNGSSGVRLDSLSELLNSTNDRDAGHAGGAYDAPLSESLRGLGTFDLGISSGIL